VYCPRFAREKSKTNTLLDMAAMPVILATSEVEIGIKYQGQPEEKVHETRLNQ
jgi:hypothetical protein